MECKYCHAEIPDDSSFCEFCGKKVTPDKPKSKTWLLWVMIVAVLGLAAAIAYNFVLHNKKEQERQAFREKLNEEKIQELKDDYENAIKHFDFYVESIVVDKEGREGAVNWVIEALKSLQKIEEDEKDPLFDHLGKTAVFRSKYEIYIARLREAKTNIYQHNKEDLDNGLQNKLCDELRIRLRLIDTILEQAQDNSVANIQLKAPKTNND